MPLFLNDLIACTSDPKNYVSYLVDIWLSCNDFNPLELVKTPKKNIFNRAAFLLMSFARNLNML
jgi:hypothetical protein